MRIKSFLAAMFGLVALVSLGVAGSVRADDGWSHYRNDALGVSIDFPGEPDVSVEPGGDAQLKWTTTIALYAKPDGAAFGLFCSDYDTEAVADPAGAVSAAIEGELSSFKATIVSRTDLKLADGAGADFVAKGDGNDAIIRGHVEFHGHRLYQLLVMASGELPPEADRFFASFHPDR